VLKSVKKILLKPVFGTRSLGVMPATRYRAAAAGLASVSSLVRAGYPIEDAFRTVGSMRRFRREVRGLFITLADEIQEGVAVSVLLKRYPYFFPLPSAEIVAAGEKTGKFAKSLTRASESIDSLLEQRQSIVSQFLYHAILIFICIIISSFMAYAVYPTLEKIATSNDLPDDTFPFILLGLFNLIAEYLLDYYFVCLPIVAGIFILMGSTVFIRIYLPFLSWWSEIRDYLLLPGRRYRTLAFTFRLMGDALDAGSDLQKALEYCGRASGSLWVAKLFRKASDSIVSGEPVKRVLFFSGFIPRDIAALFFSNDISSEVFYDIARFLRLRSETTLNRIRQGLYYGIYFLVGLWVALQVSILHLVYIDILGAI